MSTYLGEKQTQKLESPEDLYGYFESFAKKRDEIRVGLEAEFFAVNKITGRAVSYDGEQGIESILEYLAGKFGYEIIREEKRIIALKRRHSFVTLEPGGQVELSAPPTTNVFEVELQIRQFLEELRDARSRFENLEWLAVGIQPFSPVHEISWVPKVRYGIMADHFKHRGTLSFEMMKCTATNQVNFDYTSEENAMESLRVVMGITSIVSALFANSSFSEGSPNGFLTKRLHIWNHTDPARTGLLTEFLGEGKTFRDYLAYLLDMPMMFIVRQGEWVPLKGLPFRNFISDGFQGTFATVSDFELHLSTAFPEARLKQYLEIRGVDCQKPALIPAVAAFWKGILYRPEARQKAWEQVSFAAPQDILRLHHEIPVQGLKASLAGRPIAPIASELVEIACSSLAEQKVPEDGRNECQFLNRIRKEIIKPGLSPAETLLASWNGPLERNPTRLIEYLSIG